MKPLVSALLIFSGFLAVVGGCVSQSPLLIFIPVPDLLAPTAEFGCPPPGTVFTYDVSAWNTNRPNRMIAIAKNQLTCRINSDAQGFYDWFGGLGPHLDDSDAAEKKLITDLWPLQAGATGSIAEYHLPSKYSGIEYAVVAYGLVRVPAGIFWAYKVRKDYYWQNKLYHTAILWWAPSLKWSVVQWIEDPGKPSVPGGYNWKLVSVLSEQTQSDKGSDRNDLLSNGFAIQQEVK